MGTQLTVLYDACVLYPAPLRDLLMQLALSGIFRARWTDAIHDEWTRNLLKNRPDLTLEQLTRTQQLMNRSVPDCLIEYYEDLISSLELPDPNDRHILAAAIKGDVDAIVTFNLSDFPKLILEKYQIEALHPDNFLCDLIDFNAERVAAAVKICRQRLKNPPKTAHEYLEILSKQSLTLSVSMLRELYAKI